MTYRGSPRLGVVPMWTGYGPTWTDPAPMWTGSGPMWLAQARESFSAFADDKAFDVLLAESWHISCCHTLVTAMYEFVTTPSVMSQKKTNMLA